MNKSIEMVWQLNGSHMVEEIEDHEAYRRRIEFMPESVKLRTSVELTRDGGLVMATYRPVSGLFDVVTYPYTVSTEDE